MNHCDSCKHWKPPDERMDFADAVRFDGDEWDMELDGYERGSKDDKLFGECQLITLGSGLDLNEPSPLAVTRDASDYTANLFTQAEFGCVLWATKEEPN